MRPIYYLEFDDPAGTDRIVFATFRLHHAWAKRLRKGRVVMLANSKTRQVYGKARVVDVIPGKAKQVLEGFAHMSHLEPLVANYPTPEAFDRAAAAAAERRFASMVRRYGPNRIAHDTNITAIILSRITERRKAHDLAEGST